MRAPNSLTRSKNWWTTHLHFGVDRSRHGQTAGATAYNYFPIQLLDSLTLCTLSPSLNSLSYPFHQRQLTRLRPISPLPIQPLIMSARGFSSAVRPVARQLTKSAVQRRTFVAAMGAATRATAAVARPALAGPVQQQTRGVKTIDFAGVKEDVYGKLAPPQSNPPNWS